MTNTWFNESHVVEMKIAGLPLAIDLSKVDQTWLVGLIEYGTRRKINDSYSGMNEANGFKPEDKHAACKAMVRDMEKGEPMPERASGGVSVVADPILALAMKNAKAALTAIFRTVTGKGKAIDFAAHAAAKPFFNVKDGAAVWNDAIVLAWMAKQAATGKADYMADAAATLAAASDGLEAALGF